MPAESDRPLTDLEGAVLSSIAARGEATTYQVARGFETSPSEYWSGSAGAVYPLIKRMLSRGILEGTAGVQGKRAHTTYRLTRAGAAAHHAWLFDAGRAAGMGFDPLRTRMAHMGSVSPELRAEFLATVEARLIAFAAKPGFPDRPDLERIHQSWLAAQLGWVRALREM